MQLFYAWLYPKDKIVEIFDTFGRSIKDIRFEN